MPSITASNTTIEYFDGFDDYNADQMDRCWTTEVRGTINSDQLTNIPIDSEFSIAAGGGRNSTNSLRFQTSIIGGKGWSITLAPQTIRTVGVAVSMSAFTDTGGNPATIIALVDTGTIQIHLQVNQDGTLSVLRGNLKDGLVIGGPSIKALSVDTYYYIEFSAVIDDTTGSFSVYVDRIEWLSGTGLNTRQTANNYSNQVVLGTLAISASGMTVDFDDFYSRADGTVMGDQRVETRFANANGTINHWTPSTNSNFYCVNENPADDDTSYISSDSFGEIDLYIYPPLPTINKVSTVNAVMICAVEKVDIPGATSAAAVYRFNYGPLYTGGIQNVNTIDYSAYMDIHGRNPSTGLTWTIDEVNNFQYGVRRFG
jgi:hypothetical protein